MLGPVPKGPLADNVAPLNVTSIASPGDYFQGSLTLAIRAFAGIGAGQPARVAVFYGGNYQYNCVEIDVEYGTAPRGFSVPDVWGLQVFENQNPENFVGPLTGPELYQGDVSLPNALNPGWPRTAREKDWVNFPVQTRLPVVLGDPSTSAQIGQKEVFRIYGIKPYFNMVRLALWWNNDPAIFQSIPGGGGTFVEPIVYFRVWYDPDIRSVTTL